jgi:hypothetical protein
MNSGDTEARMRPTAQTTPKSDGSPRKMMMNKPMIILAVFMSALLK